MDQLSPTQSPTPQNPPTPENSDLPTNQQPDASEPPIKAKTHPWLIVAFFVALASTLALFAAFIYLKRTPPPPPSDSPQLQVENLASPTPTIQPAVASYGECLESPGSRIENTNPPTCIARDNQRFTYEKEAIVCGGIVNMECPSGYTCQLPAIYSPEAGGTCIPEAELNYTCPQSQSITCRQSPTESISAECRPEYAQWAATNCDGFQGVEWQ